MTPDRIERETLIAAPVERVWELVTAPEHVGTWFGDAGAEIDLRPGGAMALRWEERGTLLRVVESGFAALDVPADEQERKAKGNGDGWDHELRDLAEYARSEVAARP